MYMETQKQTAVQWLESKMKEFVEMSRDGRIDLREIRFKELECFERAKEMEREQAIDLIKQTAMFVGASKFDKEIAAMTYEDVYDSYYNETYQNK